MIIVAGDIHGNFGVLNSLIARHREISLILQVGDFGFWPRSTPQNPHKIKNGNTIICWAPGNHEDWEVLGNLTNNEVFPNVFYMERGSVLTLEDGRNVLFMGGALSIDRKFRVERSCDYGWFHEETISQKDIEELPDDHIDIVISHTAPNIFPLYDYHEEYKIPKDPSRDALDFVFKKYHPDLWYFGHMHRFQKGCTSGCVWTGLSAVNYSGEWWTPLEEKFEEKQ